MRLLDGPRIGGNGTRVLASGHPYAPAYPTGQPTVCSGGRTRSGGGRLAIPVFRVIRRSTPRSGAAFSLDPAA